MTTLTYTQPQLNRIADLPHPLRPRRTPGAWEHDVDSWIKQLDEIRNLPTYKAPR